MGLDIPIGKQDGLLARRRGAAKLSIWVVLELPNPMTAMLDIPIGSKDGPSTKRHGAANIKAVGAQQHLAPLHKYRWYLDLTYAIFQRRRMNLIRIFEYAIFQR